MTRWQNTMVSYATTIRSRKRVQGARQLAIDAAEPEKIR